MYPKSNNEDTKIQKYKLEVPFPFQWKIKAYTHRHNNIEILGCSVPCANNKL
jgi:hypothetical protein